MRASILFGAALLGGVILGSSCVVRAQTWGPAYPPPYDQGYGGSPQDEGYGGSPQDENFYAVLSPYGEWVDVAPFGAVWRPYDSVVGVDFVPYTTGGSWVYTDAGWAFDSTWSWGWAPFHYGRWVFLNGPGWVWVPGTQWAPAWVTWRFGGGVVGWCPMPPEGYAFYNSPGWVFVDTPYFGRRDYHRYLLPREQIPRAWHAATPVGIAGGHPVGPPPRALEEHGATVIRAPIRGPRAVPPAAARIPPGAARPGPSAGPPPGAPAGAPPEWGRGPAREIPPPGAATPPRAEPWGRGRQATPPPGAQNRPGAPAPAPTPAPPPGAQSRPGAPAPAPTPAPTPAPPPGASHSQGAPPPGAGRPPPGASQPEGERPEGRPPPGHSREQRATPPPAAPAHEGRATPPQRHNGQAEQHTNRGRPDGDQDRR